MAPAAPDIVIDVIGGTAQLGSMRVPIEATGGGALRLGGPGGPVLRPLRFGERADAIVAASRSLDPRRAVAHEVTRRARVDSAPDSGAAAVDPDQDRAVPAAAEAIIALHLAGADSDGPGFAQATICVARATGWSLDQINDARAGDIDRLARSQGSPRGSDEPCDEMDGGWRTFVLAPAAPAAICEPNPVPDTLEATLDAICDRLAAALLDRADVAIPRLAVAGAPARADASARTAGSAAHGPESSSEQRAGAGESTPAEPAREAERGPSRAQPRPHEPSTGSPAVSKTQGARGIRIAYRSDLTSAGEPQNQSIRAASSPRPARSWDPSGSRDAADGMAHPAPEPRPGVRVTASGARSGVSASLAFERRRGAQRGMSDWSPGAVPGSGAERWFHRGAETAGGAPRQPPQPGGNRLNSGLAAARTHARDMSASGPAAAAHGATPAHRVAEIVGPAATARPLPLPVVIDGVVAALGRRAAGIGPAAPVAAAAARAPAPVAPAADALVDHLLEPLSGDLDLALTDEVALALAEQLDEEADVRGLAR